MVSRALENGRDLAGRSRPTIAERGAKMERFTLFYALTELSKDENRRNEIKEVSLLYAVTLIVFVLSYPVIRHLA